MERLKNLANRLAPTASLDEVMALNSTFLRESFQRLHIRAGGNFAAAMKDAVKLLNAAGVEFVLIGSNALHVYNYTRATKDIDFAVDYNALTPIMALSKKYGFDRVTGEGGNLDPVKLRHAKEGVVIELVVFHPDKLDAAMSGESARTAVHGTELLVPSLGLLLGYKLDSKRVKDQADAIQLILHNPELRQPNSDLRREVEAVLQKLPNGSTLLQRLQQAVHAAETEEAPFESNPT